MRVLHVTDTYLPRRGGIELHVRDLAGQQRAAGHDVDVLTLTRNRSELTLPDGEHVLRPAESAGVLVKARFVARNCRLGALDTYDVVHAHSSTASPLVYATILAATSVPTAITVHSLWRRYTGFYRAADHVLPWSGGSVAWSAVSTAAASYIRRAARRDLRVDVVPNGIDLSEWSQHRRQPDPNHLRIVSVMRLAARKRPLALLRILRSVRNQLPRNVRVSAVVVGDGPGMDATRRFTIRHDMANWLTFTGHLRRSQIQQHLAEADVFVAPSTLESFGIAALEAAATGLPVVGRSGTGLADFVEHGVSGLLLPHDAAISAALVEMGRAGVGLQSVRPARLSSLAWPAVLDRTHELYERAGLTADRQVQFSESA